MEHQNLNWPTRAAISAICLIVTGLLLGPLVRAAAASLASLLPAVGGAQTFTFTLHMQGPSRRPEGDRLSKQSPVVTLTRISSNSVTLKAQGDVPPMDGQFAIDERGRIAPDDMPNPFVDLFNHAIAVSEGRSASVRVGDRWTAPIDFMMIYARFGPPPPGAPMPPPGGPMPPPKMVRFKTGEAPPPIVLHVQVVAVQGSAIKLVASGSQHLTLPTPNGTGEVQATINAEETIVGGRLVSYSESTSSVGQGPDGPMSLTSTNVITAKP